MAQDKDFTLQCGYLELDLSTPIVMGILNVTPDSFFDGGKYSEVEAAIVRAEQMIEQGAGIVDIGAVSSRPGALAPTLEDEWIRLRTILEELRGAFPSVPLSVDTWRSEIAKRAVDCGANLINDISGGQMDSAMFGTMGRLNAAYVCMHMKGTPEKMQEKPHYNNVVEEVRTYFSNALTQLSRAGVSNVILDPGFGFGKAMHHNYNLMRELPTFVSMGKPVLVGVSRKSMITKFLDVSKGEALNGTTALHMIALQKGANILRVHDVKEAVECIGIYNMC